jgi:hypothetical protein
LLGAAEHGVGLMAMPCSRATPHLVSADAQLAMIWCDSHAAGGDSPISSRVVRAAPATHRRSDVLWRRWPSPLADLLDDMARDRRSERWPRASPGIAWNRGAIGQA